MALQHLNQLPLLHSPLHKHIVFDHIIIITIIVNIISRNDSMFTDFSLRLLCSQPSLTPPHCASHLAGAVWKEHAFIYPALVGSTGGR